LGYATIQNVGYGSWKSMPFKKKEISLNLGGNSFSMISHDLRKMPVEGVKWNVEKL
jgi:hypothetical protein